MTDQNVRANHHPSRSPIGTTCGIGPVGEGAAASGKRYRGTKKALATNVGTTALPMTVQHGLLVAIERLDRQMRAPPAWGPVPLRAVAAGSSKSR